MGLCVCDLQHGEPCECDDYLDRLAAIRARRATPDTCELAVGDQPGRCSWCGDPLTGRRRRWCSDACAEAWPANSFARHRRIEDRRAEVLAQLCQRAAAAGFPLDFPGASRRRLEGHDGAPWYGYNRPVVTQQQLCEHPGGCDTDPRDRNGWITVHHEPPALGRHALFSCAHHQDKLHVLCQRHHLQRHAEMNRDARRAAAAVREVGPYAQLSLGVSSDGRGVG